MRHKYFARIAALLAIVITAVCLTPATVWADSGVQLQDPSVTYLDEENALLEGNTLVAGKDVTLYIPVINRGGVTASSITCELPYSGDALAFPFESSTQAAVQASAYKKYDAAANDGKGGLVDWTDDSLAAGERGWFQLSGVKALASLSQGNMQLVFNLNYDGAAAAQTVRLTVYVTNSDWNPSAGGGSSYKSKPKVIIESYSFDRDRIYAGDTVRVNICVRNTSLTEAITNLQLDYSDEGGKILPSSGSSNSVFLGSIEKGEAYQLVLFLDIAPDAEAKTYALGVKLVYEGTKNRSEFTEETSIGLAVLQRIRIRLTDPVIYGDPWVGQGTSMSLSLYNLSKATIYNCSAEISGDGLSLEEPFFGGNIAAGGTMRADLSVISEQAGEVAGQIIITYENIYGETTTETVDFSMFVNEMAAAGDDVDVGVMMETEQPQAKGLGWYWWLLIAAAVIAGAVLLIITLQKRRKKYLEEL